MLFWTLQRGTQRCITQFFTSQFIPLFLQRHCCDALPWFAASPVISLYIAHIAFPPLLPISLRHNDVLYETTRSLPRVTAQRCHHWQRGMAIANANANAAMRCTKEKTPIPKISALLRKRPVLLRANFVLTKDRKRPYYGHCCGKIQRTLLWEDTQGGVL